ncbi:MAG: leucine-rich repeat domain-containing protein, partial [Paludibacteraceae bacterium]|nr:leucine-rich repeat domain-containing protein [Paludibacteraceae bacterium]
MKKNLIALPLLAVLLVGCSFDSPKESLSEQQQSSVAANSSITNCPASGNSSSSQKETTLEDFEFGGTTIIKFKGNQENVVIPEKMEDGRAITGISNRVFYDKTFIRSVTLPSTITYIGDNAFYGCYNITSMFIPRSVVQIGSQAIPSTCTAYCEASSKPFGWNEKWAENTNAVWGVQKLDTLNGMKYCLKDGLATIIEYHGDNEQLVIPDKIDGCNVTSINKSTFSKASFRTVTLPSTITTIEYNLFQSCENLISVEIPSSVTSIGSRAFRSCSSLVSVTIPQSVTSFGFEVFNGCNSLKIVTIPEGITSLPKGMFNNCY